MKSGVLKKVFLTSVCLLAACGSNGSLVRAKSTPAVYTTPDVSLRYHAQWKVEEGVKKKLHETYGIKRVSFDSKGRPVPQGLSPAQQKRWERLYHLCMGDGCYYCDAPEGSCESNTCGENNEYCKPYVGADGQPICGKGCADYAFYASSDA